MALTEVTQGTGYWQPIIISTNTDVRLQATADTNVREVSGGINSYLAAII